ncbi:hypothetical protein Hanom_Chr06g00558071 [Helianthus anomalus]
MIRFTGIPHNHPIADDICDYEFRQQKGSADEHKGVQSNRNLRTEGERIQVHKHKGDTGVQKPHGYFQPKLPTGFLVFRQSDKPHQKVVNQYEN